MQIKLLEARSGLSRDTLRFYERSGLITPPRRLPNGYRDYDEHALAEIKTAIPHLKAPPKRCRALLDGLRGRRMAVVEQIALQRQQLRRLDQLIRRFGGA
jgi:DNA-binding transcriptional MerR regulator